MSITPARNDQVKLIRGLTLLAAVSIVIGNVIGTGVFLKARVMTCNVGTPGKVVAVWVAAGLLSLAGALTYAELAAMMPRAGGEYVFVREGYGARLGFLYGWMQIFIAKTGSQASLAVAFAGFLNVLTGGSLNPTFFSVPLFGYNVSFGMLQVVALLAIAITTLINCAAVAVSGHVATLLTALKLGLVLAIGVGAFLAAGGDWSHFGMANDGGACTGVAANARYGVAGFGAAMLGALWGYDGWNNLTLVAGEVKNPQRNIPLALIGGMITIITLYVFVNIAYFYVLTPTQVAGINPDGSNVATEVARQIFGAVAVAFIAAALLASSFGSLHTSILTGARVPYAMARDGLFFQNLARLSPKTHVPIGALVLQGVWASILALSGSFDTLTDYVIFGSWIFYGLTTASVFIFRRRLPNAERPYRAWGYPVVPILFLLVTGWLLVNTLLTTPVQAFIGLGLILLGLPVYWYWARHNDRTSFQRASDVEDDNPKS
ncbi:MAG: basic amino acid/polyamine antiporter, family [Pyrinomonadaceae bacterium]|nr:basic amino acid/polyamine antiporter, family [Pyrinomonadaceae bacterium]MDX6271297.1 basic amino acid/polyamine antiporter, family [Acidobacteriota bacterium]